MRRVLIALGLILALIGLLLCWPLSRTLLTHERGRAQVLEIYRLPRPDGQVGLRTLWQAELSPGHWVLGDTQRNHFFRSMDDPTLPADEAEAVAARILPDRQGRQTMVNVFWKANDPERTAFIIDVSETHPWLRYIFGLAACCLGLVTARLAWAAQRRSAA